MKLIGATAHYVTADLDEGPIIEQDVARVDHSKTVEDLTAIGRDTESQVLARAVKWHSEHRVLINGQQDGDLQVNLGAVIPGLTRDPRHPGKGAGCRDMDGGHTRTTSGTECSPAMTGKA